MTGAGEDLGALGRQLLSGMALLARSAGIYSTENAVFLKQLQGLLEPLNRGVALARRLDVEVQASALKLNGRAVALDHAGQEALADLAQAFQARGLAALVAAGPVSLEDLRSFFTLFAKDLPEPPPDDGLPGHKMQELRLRRLSAGGLASATASPSSGESAQQARQRALKAYARGLLWADLQTRALQERRSDDLMAACPRVAQELVETSSRLPGTLLPLVLNGEGPRALSHHLVNTALVAVTFGERLGLARPQLRDLAVTALACEAPLVHVPPDLWMPADPDRLPPEHQQLRTQAFVEASQRALLSQPLRRLEQLRALAVGQMHESHKVAVRDAAGATAWKPQGDPLFVSRVLAMAAQYDGMTAPAAERPAYSQDQALGAMWGPLRHRFDTDLLWVFVRLMARIPFKVCPRAVGGALDLKA
ncbi:MAG: hypothetical protein QM765_00620 [Myxococcales bacterium]